jgi:3-hydroxybutyryl-CoA dehydratase
VNGEAPPAVVPLSRLITQEAIQRYAEAASDFNPIHIDEEFARKTPFGGTIAHGMLVLAYVSETMAAAFGRDWLAGGRLKVRFRAPARPGDTLTVRAEPRRDRQADGGRVLEYAIECSNQNGETLISGTAEVAVRGPR